MSVILVIIIVVAWIVILGPSVAKRRSRTVGGIHSISHFHRALRTLEQAAPEPIVTPAYRLRAVGGTTGAPRAAHPGVSTMPTLTVVGADRLPRPALAFLGDPHPTAEGGAAQDSQVPVATDDGWADSRRRGVEADARRMVRRRRRDTLGVLALVFAATLMIGFVPGAGAAWIVSMVSGVALVAYTAMLVQLRRSAEERERKLSYLTPRSSPEELGSMGPRIPMYMSGRYAHPSNQAAVAH